MLLWPDTFTNHFDPGIAADAVAVLEALGYKVELPPRTVCCGLTWTSTGQVAAARRVLLPSLRAIEPWLTAGVPVVGLEPSCTAALRADGAELLPDDPLAKSLAGGVRTFAELLAEHADALRAAVVGGGQGARPAALPPARRPRHGGRPRGHGRDRPRRRGARLGLLRPGGQLRVREGPLRGVDGRAERVLLPAVRAADPDVDVLADGFTCRTQLRQAGTREPVHLAQLTARALGLRRAN